MKLHSQRGAPPAQPVSMYVTYTRTSPLRFSIGRVSAVLPLLTAIREAVGPNLGRDIFVVFLTPWYTPIRRPNPIHLNPEYGSSTTPKRRYPSKGHNFNPTLKMEVTHSSEMAVYIDNSFSTPLSTLEDGCRIPLRNVGMH